jgi:3-keto-5-aminohexanoate cleavage enzyme
MDCIINFTPTGMIPTKTMTPYVPISVEEIVEQVLEATEYGITMVHLHAREELTGAPTYKAEIYGKIISGIRMYNKEIILGVSTSGRTFSELSKRLEPLTLEGEMKPDMGSLTLNSTNFNKDVSVNSPEVITALAQEMKKRGILPELEVFDTGMINFAKYLEKKGFINRPHYFNLILGNIACAQADLLHAGVMMRDLPQDSIWSMGGIGDYQLMVNTISIASGGGVRVGLEDNIWYDTGRTKLARNIDLLKRLVILIEIQGSKPMKPIELRKLLGLKPGNGQYGCIR